MTAGAIRLMKVRGLVMNNVKIQDGTINISDLPTADNALMWYVAFLPLFAIVFDYYSSSIYHGIVLWGLVILVRIAVCAHDNRKLIKLGMWQGNTVSPAVFFPVIYIIKRFTWLKRSSSIVVFAVASLVFGIMNNGFVTNAFATDETFCDYVSEYYTNYITNLPDDKNIIANTDDTIDMLIKKHCYGKSFTGEDTEKEVRYSYEETGSEKLVTATASLSGQVLEITFILDYDGYYFGGMEISSVALDGKLLDENERDELITEIFMYELSEEEE